MTQGVLEEAQEITSGSTLDDIETHFRILAGPGAGKTYWLVNHIKKVIRHSKRLGPNQRIACISYTTVAADEIESRLGPAAAHVDVSTIHSFLYRNLVGPYLPWVTDDSEQPEVDYNNVDGHTPHSPITPILKDWVEEVSNMSLWQFDDREAISKYLKKLRWGWNPEDQSWELVRPGYSPEDYFPCSESNLRIYKKRYWDAGIIDHEDVLYFALRILNENPEIERFLASRYPYIFVDEFQDTNPAQTEVLRKLAGSGSITGVIGDEEQAIFKFAGAKPQDLLSFSPCGQKTYRITTNRRSTKPILDLLNRIRKSNAQKVHSEKGLEEESPMVLVGRSDALQEYVRNEVDQEVRTLARKNTLVRRLAGSTLPEKQYDEAWEKLSSSDPDRTEWLQAVIEATREASGDNPRYGQAVKIIYRGLKTRNGRLLKSVFTKRGDRKLSRVERRRAAASLLPFLLSRQSSHKKMTGLDFYLNVREQMNKILPNTPLKKPSRGEYHNLLKETHYNTLYATARLHSGDGKVKTIHKAKGEEYPTVLILRESNDGKEDEPQLIRHVLNPDSTEGEERRVTYVGLSRAEKRLFIGVERLSEDLEATLKKIGLDVKHIS